MYRRNFLGTITVGSLVLASGCLDELQESDDASSSPEQTTPSENESERETCQTERDVVTDTSSTLEGGYMWVSEYRCEEDDLVNFDISASDGQDIEVEIESPRGETLFTDEGLSISTSQRMTNGGRGEVRVKNLGERTRTERDDLWDSRENMSAGASLDYWAEMREGNSVDYYIRKVDGARPKLRIEDENGTVIRDHSVSEVIDDQFTAPEDGRYYFIMENTAMITSGVWDYVFERVDEYPIDTTVDLLIEREYEVCE